MRSAFLFPSVSNAKASRLFPFSKRDSTGERNRMVCVSDRSAARE